MNCRFFLLDVNEGEWEGKPCARFWGIDTEGKRVLILASQITPYFYFLPSAPVDLESLRSKLMQHKKFSKVLDVIVEQRRLLGNRQEVFKVLCSDPAAASKYCKAVPRFIGGGRCFDDLRLPVRYMTDCALTPCGWNACEVEQVDTQGMRVDRIYVAKALPYSLQNTVPPNLRVLAFTTLSVAEKGSANPDADPIRAIGLATDSGHAELLQTTGDDDLTVLKAFSEYVENYDPDVIVGFDTAGHHWPYLMKRCKRKNARLMIGRDLSEPHSSVFGHISTTGRANLDLSDLASRIPEVKIKTIENTAKFFGVPAADKIMTVDEFELNSLWGTEKGREMLLENTRLIAKGCLEVAQAAIDYPMQLSAITGLPLDQVISAAVGFRVDSYFVRQAYQIGELIPTKNAQSFFTYQGAIVLEPRSGVHENVVVLDFTSMYPRLMVKHNLSPDTYVTADEHLTDERVWVIPELGHRFRKKPDGFFKIVITSLIRNRELIKQEMENQTPNSPSHKLLKERERAVKIITNACYGYAGWAGGRWYVREIAESATALGRQTIRKTSEKAKSMGMDIFYSDTDSIFVTNDPPKLQQLIDWVNNELGLTIRIERQYDRILFTEAMKRYAGLAKDGTLDFVGLEAIRGDWSDIAREVQEEVLVRILKEQSVKSAVECATGTIRQLREGRVPITKLVIRKTLTKPIEKYAIRTPHVEVAKQLASDGWDIGLGDKVAYVVTKGSGPLYKKVKPLNRVRLEDVDFEYYVTSQVKPAAMRVLERLGVDEGQVLA
ncbi:MAG TPA: DNA polymerase domain-containing protein [Candidatus Acidoferrales bacterium]|nr:DNA polymerase domain-containing protein [Candidatus Acidoferrales bacterium]